MAKLSPAQRSAMTFLAVEWDEPKPRPYQRIVNPMRDQCSALAANECRNGFPITGGCLGYQQVPICMHEEMCGALYPDAGKPTATA